MEADKGNGEEPVKKSSWFSSTIQKMSNWKDAAVKETNRKLHAIEKGIEKVAIDVKYQMISRETEEVYTDISNIFKEHFKDSRYGKTDYIMGICLLSTYYDTNTRRTHKMVHDKEFVKKGLYYMKFASGAYGWKLLYGLGREGIKDKAKGIKDGVQEGDKANISALCTHTGIKEEDILHTKWVSDKIFENGHFLAYDHNTRSIIVSIRGTFHVRDAMVDLLGRNVPFYDGLAHEGILTTARKKHELLEPLIEEAVKKYPDYTITVVGHSLGAGTAALLTVMFINEHPAWKVKGYCYAPPCVMSHNLSKKYRDSLTSFILQNDVVPRMCIASIEALKNTTEQLLSQADNNFQRMYQLFNVGNTLGDEYSKKISNFVKAKEVDFSAVKIDLTIHEKLVPPGMVFWMFKPKDKKVYSMEKSKHAFFTEIVIGQGMYTDHMPTAYEAAFKSVIESEEPAPLIDLYSSETTVIPTPEVKNEIIVDL